MEAFVESLGMPFIAVVVPLLVAAIKGFLPRVPKPMLPILAAVLGPAVDALMGWVSGMELMGWQAAVAGLAGVGVREVVDQVKRSIPSISG